MKKTEVFLKKHSSTLLTVVGAGGVIATSVLSVKATPKALLLLEESKKEKGEELTAIETVKVAWKPYIPAIITGASTIVCIFGANYLSMKSQASLMSAYAVLDNSFKEYRNAVKNSYTDEDARKHFDSKIKHDIVESHLDKDMDIDDGKELFFDYQTMTWFRSTMKEVKEAEKIFNEHFANSGFACVNDFYEILGVDPVEYGYQLGWSTMSNDNAYAYSELAFEYEKANFDGMECWIMTMPLEPTIDFY